MANSVEWQDTSAAVFKNTSAAVWRKHGLNPDTITEGIEFSDNASARAIFLALSADGFKFSDTTIASLLVTLTDGLKFSDTAALITNFKTAIATDGIKFSDTALVLATFLATSSEGIKFSDAVQAAAVEILTDGIEFSDTATPLAKFLATSTDGIKFSDLATAAAIEVLSDGIKFSDTTVAAAVEVLTDGIKFSDTPSTLATFLGIASDGIEFSDAVLAAAVEALVDGIKFSDSSGEPVMTYLPVAADGIKFSDAASTLAKFLATSTDGIKFSDLAAVIANFKTMSVSDGFKFSDTVLEKAGFSTVLTDGFKFSDSALSAFVETLTEGIEFSDSLVGYFAELVQDGIKFSDTTTALAELLAEAIDGIVFSDTPTPKATFQGVSADGIVFSEPEVRYVGVTFAVAEDGIVFSEIVGPRMDHSATLSEGIVLSDTTVGIAVESLSEGLVFADSSGEPVMTYLPVATDGILFRDDDSLFFDPCTFGQTYADKWTKLENNSGTSYPAYFHIAPHADQLRCQITNTASRSRACNTQPIPLFKKSGLYEIDFTFYSDQNWGGRDLVTDNPDDGNNIESKIEIMKPDPDSKKSNDFYELEEAWAGVGAKLSLNLRTNASEKINIREYFEGAPTMLLNTPYTYNGTSGDSFTWRFDLTNKWSEVLDSNGVVIGERVVLSDNFLGALEDPFLLNIHFAGYATWADVHYDDIEIRHYRQTWARADYKATSADGIKFSEDTVDALVKLQGYCSDAIVFDDTATVRVDFGVEVEDGFKFSEYQQVAWPVELEQGIKFGDSVIWIRPYDKDEIDVQPKGVDYTFKALAKITNFTAFKKQFATDAFDLSIPIAIQIHPQETNFKALSKPFDFKAQPKDFNTEV